MEGSLLSAPSAPCFFFFVKEPTRSGVKECIQGLGRASLHLKGQSRAAFKATKNEKRAEKNSSQPPTPKTKTTQDTLFNPPRQPTYLYPNHLLCAIALTHLTTSSLWVQAGATSTSDCSPEKRYPPAAYRNRCVPRNFYPPLQQRFPLPPPPPDFSPIQSYVHISSSSFLHYLTPILPCRIFKVAASDAAAHALDKQ